MSEAYSTENFNSNFESNKYGIKDDSKLESFGSYSFCLEKGERHDFMDKDYDTLLTVINC